jgi:hypothetical protein
VALRLVHRQLIKTSAPLIGRELGKVRIPAMRYLRYAIVARVQVPGLLRAKRASDHATVSRKS